MIARDSGEAAIRILVMMSNVLALPAAAEPTLRISDCGSHAQGGFGFTPAADWHRGLVLSC